MSTIRQIIVSAALCCTAPLALAYETATHKTLTETAVGKSIVAKDPVLLPDLGFQRWDDSTANYLVLSADPNVYTAATATGAIAAGAIYEDDQYKTRAFNHFFDPQRNRALTVAGVTLGLKSPDWILEDQGLATDMGMHAQEFSFRKAYESLFTALIGDTSATRFAAFSRMLQTLGHVVHHIQDMGQPQHTRNDQHAHPIFGINPQWSFYERWTAANSKEVGQAATLDYPIPQFPTARQFWYAPADSAQYKGMAEFTSKNFVSYNTEYVSVQGGTISGASEYPLPSGLNVDGTAKSLASEGASVTLPDESAVTGNFQFLKGKVYDGYTGSTTTLRLASASALNDIIRVLKGSGPLKFTENSLVYSDAYSVLLPRAVAFSAGLINHFFRGRLDLRPGSGSTWIVQNVGTQAMTGNLWIAAEDGNGKRGFIPGAFYQVSLAANQTQSITLQPASGTTKLIAAFQGKIGDEGDASLASGYYAVTGKVVPYLPPALPCGVPINTGGSSEGLDVQQELGDKSGTVQVKFDAYVIPDRLDITTLSGTKLVSTDALVSDVHSYSFNHDPVKAGSTRVRLRVTGNSNRNTIWSLTVGCPGQVLPQPPTVQLSFGADGPVSGLVCSGTICTPPCQGYWSMGAGDIHAMFGTANTLVQGQSYKYTVQWTPTGVTGPIGCAMQQPYYFDPSGKHYISPGPGTLTVQQYGNGGGG